MAGKSTYWAKCRFPSVADNESPLIYPWELREVAPGNFAAYATKRFDEGDVILLENALVTVRGWHPFTLDQQLEIEENLSRLDNQLDYDAFYDLANVFESHTVEDVRQDGGKTLLTRAAGIFMTNCFDMTDSPMGEGCAIYAAIARLNHSCQPNAQQTHLPETGEEVLIASRTIEIGEEICDCYIDLRQPRALRQKVLSDLFRFDCRCEACSMSASFVESDDKLREKALKLDDLIITAAEEDPSIALDVSLDYIRLLETPAVKKWSVRYIPGAHFSCYQLSSELGQKAKGRSHLLQAHEWNIRLTGPDSPASKRTFSLLSKSGGGRKSNK